MQITKFQHACFAVEDNGRMLIVDPGELSTDFLVPEEPVVAVVVTHVHPDHIDQDKLRDIQEQHPETIILAHQEVIDMLDDDIVNTQSVASGDVVSIDHFDLEFTGGEHALIHPDIPMCANLGVHINETVYYPGDSFAKPAHDVHVLALPIAAPWMKTAEGMNFLVEVNPGVAFATHDAVLSDTGKLFADNWMKRAAETIGCDYRRLDTTPFVLE